MIEKLMAPMSQRMATVPYRDFLPRAEQLDLPMCSGSRRSPEVSSAGGGGGQLTYASPPADKICKERPMDVQEACQLRSKLSSWGIAENSGRPKFAVPPSSYPQAGQDTINEQSRRRSECDIFEFEGEEFASGSRSFRAEADLPLELRRAFEMAMDSSFTGFDMNLRADVDAILADAQGFCQKQNVDDPLESLAEGLRSRGYLAQVQSSPGWHRTSGTNFSLKHRFICCMPPSDSFDVTPRIVDPSFKDQFDIACPSLAYRSLLELVPRAFVGSAVCLQTVVETLCDQMAESFSASSMPTPPWRRIQSLLSMWLPVSSAHLRFPQQCQ